jgi:hypothetical protein
LITAEIKAIKEANQQYPALGSWNLSLLLSNEFAVHVSTMSILRVLYPERYKSSKIAEKVKCYEKPMPHHADTMEVTLESGLLIHQISVEDDDSRGYMALCVFPKKLSYFVILTLLRAFRLHSKPELFHHDNGGEYDNAVVSRLLQMLDIVAVPTEVENPKGNGKKERAHSRTGTSSMITIRFGKSSVLKRRFLNIFDSETSRRGSGLGMEKPLQRY